MLCRPLRVKLNEVNWGHSLKSLFLQPQSTVRRSQARTGSSSGLSELNPDVPRPPKDPRKHLPCMNTSDQLQLLASVTETYGNY